VGVHDRRVRKSGPAIALVVARCRTHAVAFTIYPPGYVPYGRAPTVPVDLAGRPVRTPSGSLSWPATIFGAAIDAAAGRRWPLEGTEPGARRTQGRRLALTAPLLGLCLATDERTRERIASSLSIPLLALRQVPRASLHAGGSWSERGQMITSVLALLREPRRVLAAGEVAGLWGRPSRWDPGGQALRRPF